jgi:Protein of unknown function (DUF1565)
MTTPTPQIEARSHPERNLGRIRPAITGPPPDPVTRRWRRRVPLALVAAALLAGALALAAPAGAQAATISVSAATGNDANPGTATAPLKTLTKALSKAKAGDTVKLAGGGYGTTPQGFGSGETFPAGGLDVPSGVTIEGQTDFGFPVSTLLGQGSGVGLNLKGNATVRNLVVGGFRGFGVGLVARQGTQTLSNLLIPVSPARTGNVDGVPFSAGIVLRGSAQAILNAGAQQSSTTGSKILLDSGTGVSVNEQARLTMNGGQINGGDQPNCRTNATGIELNGAAQATLKNMLGVDGAGGGFRNIAGTALRMSGTSKATVSDSALVRRLPAECQARPSVEMGESAALTFDRGISQSFGGDNAVGIQTQVASGPALTLKRSSSVSTDRGTALELLGPATVAIDESFPTTGRGIAIDGPSAALTITRSFVEGPSTGDPNGAAIRAGRLKLRQSTVRARRGILVTGAGVDLGTAGDPGNNDLSQIVDTAVRFDTDGVRVRAEGNTWLPNTQGSDASGRYPKPLFVTPKSPLANGRNFDLTSFFFQNVAIELGPGTAVGNFRLSPRTLTARAGRPASWRLAWTHPVDWKRLDRVVLRLEHKGKPVGRITLDQETRRLRATGPAVRLVGGRSAVATGQAGGKKVTARLVLRIARRYAGRTLVAKLAATDDVGQRQGFRRAGRVRVLAR